jgi:hypothetical protein
VASGAASGCNWQEELPLTWAVDLDRMEAQHTSGLVVRFTPDPDGSGAWDGTPIEPLPTEMDVSSAARLMREAGDAVMSALRARTKS